MSAETLRKAAALMREGARDNTLTSERVMPTAVYLNAAKYLVLTPAVALAVAGWLEGVANLLDYDRAELAEVQAAHTVARAYLGESA